MKRSYFFILAAIMIAVIALVAAYVAGVRVGRSQAEAGFNTVLASVQGDLGLTKLQRLRELESDLSHDCANEALVKVRFDIQTQLLVLSSLYDEHKGTWVVEDLAKRDPDIIEELKSFKQQHKSWTEPRCPT